MKKTKMTRRQKTILIILSLPILCLCSIIMATIPPTESSQNSSLPPTLTINQTPTPLQHKKFMAQIKCQRFVKDRLVSPSSAKFSNEQSYKVNGEPLNYHAVTGVVESQNRMAVRLRSQYRCDTHYSVSDPGSWVLDYLDIED